LDALVTVIDASTFVARMNSQNTLAVDFPGIKTTEPEALNDATVDLLAASIETCDVLLVHRFETLSPDFMLSLQSCLRALQPRAKIVLAAPGQEALWVPEVLGTRLFDSEKTEESSTWRQALKKCPPESRTAPGSEPGGWLPVEIWPEADPDLWAVGVVRRFRPFHPKRLADSLDQWTDDLLRTVGQIWLATDGGNSYHLGQIGPSPVFFHPDAPWAVTASPSEQMEMRREEPELDRIWDSGHGDRFSEIVLIGPQSVIQEAVHELDRCLVTEDEISVDWSKFEDPFYEEMQAQERRERNSGRDDDLASRRPGRERPSVPWLKLVPPVPSSESAET
jgi:G3E family GTPase